MSLIQSLKRWLTPRTPEERTDFAEALRAHGHAIGRWTADIRSRSLPLYWDLPAAEVQALAARFPDLAARTLADADAVLEHRYDLLGSGPFESVDPERPERADGYRPMDWYLDPVRSLRFPVKVPYKEWDLYAMRPENADVKYPWELSRSQHFAVLGQAHALSGDARYALEIISQIEDFMQDNPVGHGVNWTCTMDVAIRAANWAIGLSLVRRCEALEEARLAAAFAALYDHGVFIFDNFENHYEVTSNHYLSNVVGLFYLAALFGDLPAARQWDEYCRTSVEHETGVQILPDGADFESSAPYHRLVLELFLGAGRLADVSGRPLSPAYRDTVGRMADYLAAMLRPDGRMPVWGDADDGRLHIFTRHGDWDRQDGLHVLAPAARFLERKDLLDYAREQDLWEAAWWGFDIQDATPAQGALPDACGHFPHAGGTVYRRGGDYVLFTNSIVGTEGFGNHKHNDQLSFELHLDGTPLIVDPGSYVYTSDPQARNQFRSTAGHNTVSVDGQEQNEFNPEWLFRTFEKAEAQHLHYADADADGMVAYCGTHKGYERFDPAVTHTRAFGFLKDAGVLLFVDELDGLDAPLARWHFHFAPGVEPRAHEGAVLLDAKGRRFALHHPPSLSATMREAWYSPSYGVRTPAKAVDLAMQSGMADGTQFAFAIGPHGLSMDDFRAPLDALRRLLPDKKGSK